MLAKVAKATTITKGLGLSPVAATGIIAGVIALNFANVARLKSVKAGLHYNDYRSKLVRFEAQKYFFYAKKALT
jgi:hypothetical protein